MKERQHPVARDAPAKEAGRSRVHSLGSDVGVGTARHRGRFKSVRIGHNADVTCKKAEDVLEVLSLIAAHAVWVCCALKKSGL